MIGNIQIQKEGASLLQLLEFLIQVKIIGDYDARSWMKKLWEKQILSLTNRYNQTIPEILHKKKGDSDIGHYPIYHSNFIFFFWSPPQLISIRTFNIWVYFW